MKQATIYVTGDTHGQKDFNKLITFAQNGQFGKQDYVIICGDFGGVWQKQTLQADLAPYEALPFTVLFLDGNHENFDLLSTFPQEEWMGGNVHRISPHILHLMRGQVYTIGGNTLFVCGGAESRDKQKRLFEQKLTGNKTWWEQESITEEDICTAKANLQKYENKVDYVLTHCPPADVCEEALKAYVSPKLQAEPFGSEEALREMLSFNGVQYKKLYCAHVHTDLNRPSFRILYNDIVKLGE